MRRKLFLTTGLLCVAIATSELGSRTFTGQDGRKIEGTLISFDGTHVKIQKNGKVQVITVAIQRLSKADQDFIRQSQKKADKSRERTIPTRKVSPGNKKNGAPVANIIPKRRITRFAESVAKTPRGDILAISKQIDKLLEDGYRRHKVKPLPTANDTVFLRRAYLDIIGRIPSHDEAVSFIEDTRSNKRTLLVDTLLDSEGQNSHAYNFWADILRLKQRFPGGGGNYGAPMAYIQWVKESIRANQPYDKFVRDLLTSEGYPWENGAVGYFMRDSGMPLDNMSNTVQVFLGTQMVCAQCHNHPFDKWTQMDYYKLAAYTYEAHTRVNSPLRGQAQAELKRQYGAKAKYNSDKERRKVETEIRRKLGRSMSEIFKPLAYGVQEQHNRQLRLPHDYQYNDAKPKATVEPSPLFGEDIDTGDFESKRTAYAEWMTSPKNPRFTQVIVNRLWKRAMGRGLIEPVDDLRDDTAAANPELLRYLEKQMVALGYDMKQFLRVIYNTRAYNRETYSGELGVIDKFPFQGPVMKRLTAEQIWDSYVTLSLPSPDHRKASFKGTETKMEGYHRYEKILNSKTPTEVAGMIKEGAKLEARMNEQLRTIQEKILKAQKEEDFDTLRNLRREYGKIRRERESRYMLLATDGINVMEGNEYGKGMSYYGNMKPNRNESAQWKGYSRALLRASELPNPAPLGHFLRQFGQSDRELIENSSQEASIPQALTLMNGRLFVEVARPLAPLNQNISALKTPEEKIRAIYLSILSRLPDEDEMTACMEVVNKHPEALERVKLNPKTRKPYNAYMKAPWSDITWAVLNTQEFLFRL